MSISSSRSDARCPGFCGCRKKHKLKETSQTSAANSSQPAKVPNSGPKNARNTLPKTGADKTAKIVACKTMGPIRRGDANRRMAQPET